MKRISIMLLVSALALGACSSGEDSDSGAKRPSSTAKLQILEPTPGGTLPVDEPIIKLQLDGATILSELSSDVRPDTGHVHVKLDSQTISLLAGLEANINDMLAEKKLPPLTKGQHLLEVEFAAADHGFFDPRVVVTTPFVAV